MRFPVLFSRPWSLLLVFGLFVCKLSATELVSAPQALEADIRAQKAMLSAGIQAEREGKLDVAGQEYEKCLQLTRQIIIKNQDRHLAGPVLHRLAVLHAKKGQHGESERFFREAVQHDAKNVALLCDFAKLYSDQNKHHDAEIILKKAVVVAPDHRRALFNLGHVVATQPDRQTEGLRYLKLALGDALAFRELAKVCRAAGNADQAEFAEQRAVVIERTQPNPTEESLNSSSVVMNEQTKKELRSRIQQELLRLEAADGTAEPQKESALSAPKVSSLPTPGHDKTEMSSRPAVKSLPQDSLPASPPTKISNTVRPLPEAVKRISNSSESSVSNKTNSTVSPLPILVLPLDNTPVQNEIPEYAAIGLKHIPAPTDTQRTSSVPEMIEHAGTQPGGSTDGKTVDNSTPRSGASVETGAINVSDGKAELSPPSLAQPPLLISLDASPVRMPRKRTTFVPESGKHTSPAQVRSIPVETSHRQTASRADIRRIASQDDEVSTADFSRITLTQTSQRSTANATELKQQLLSLKNAQAAEPVRSLSFDTWQPDTDVVPEPAQDGLERSELQFALAAAPNVMKFEIAKTEEDEKPRVAEPVQSRRDEVLPPTVLKFAPVKPVQKPADTEIAATEVDDVLPVPAPVEAVPATKTASETAAVQVRPTAIPVPETTVVDPFLASLAESDSPPQLAFRSLPPTTALENPTKSEQAIASPSAIPALESPRASSELVWSDMNRKNSDQRERSTPDHLGSLVQAPKIETAYAEPVREPTARPVVRPAQPVPLGFASVNPVRDAVQTRPLSFSPPELPTEVAISPTILPEAAQSIPLLAEQPKLSLFVPPKVSESASEEVAVKETAPRTETNETELGTEKDTEPHETLHALSRQFADSPSVESEALIAKRPLRTRKPTPLPVPPLPIPQPIQPEEIVQQEPVSPLPSIPTVEPMPKENAGESIGFARTKPRSKTPVVEHVADALLRPGDSLAEHSIFSAEEPLEQEAGFARSGQYSN